MIQFLQMGCLLLILVSVLHYPLVFSSNIHFSNHLCRQDQSLALQQLKFKLAIDDSASADCDSNGHIAYPKTFSWNSSTDCCTWDGVTCDRITGQITGLDLSCSQLHGTIDSNSTLFQLSHLLKLNLAYNDFSPSQISSKFGWFPSLAHLNLSHSGFSGKIPSEVSYLSKLISLDLSAGIEELRFGPHTFKLLLQNLTQLKELHLTSTYISSALPSNFSSSLEVLNLLSTELSGKVPDHIFHLRRLQILNLGSNLYLKGHLPKVQWNSSSSLKELDLSSSGFSGNVPDAIGHLSSLSFLDFSSCYFSGTIPQSIGNLTKLNNLRPFSNNFNGSLPSTISNLVQLVEFDISSNNFSGDIPNIFSNFTKLKSLSLADNLFTGLFPSSVTNLTKLESLILSNCSIAGPIPSIATGFPNLILLFLSDNLLTGEIPSWIFDLPSLKFLQMRANHLTGQLKEFGYNLLEVLDVGDNKLHGPIPRSFSKLVNLTTLDLSTNNFSGGLDIGMFSNCKQLRRLGLSFNNLSVFSSHKDMALPRSIGRLYASSCNIRELNFLQAATRIGQLDLSNNKIYGKIPDWAWSDWQSSLFYLNLSSNFLTAIDPLHDFENLVYLDLGSNFIQGELPAPPPRMFLFIVSKNNFTGKLPSPLCRMSTLVILDLSSNSLSGVIPKCLVNMSRSLSVLDLHDNQFHGTVPTKFGRESTLRSLNLRNNKLEGTLPQTLANCRALEVLDLGENLLNDTFPKWLGTLPRLHVLSLRSNRLHGPITTSRKQVLFSKLKILDLSYNDFSGNFPERFFRNLKAMMISDRTGTPTLYIGEDLYHDSVTVSIKGQQIELVRILSIFATIDFSSNKFEGDIPKYIGNLRSLRGLNLSHNRLIGPIPQSFGNLSVLESLDLSSNQLSGKIPQQLATLNFLSVMNLSQNHLIGRIPRGPQLDTFENDSYSGNAGLCGFPLSRNCGDNEMPQQPTSFEADEEEDDPGFMDWRAVVIGYGCGMVFGLFMGYVVFLTGRPKWFVRIVNEEGYRIVKKIEAKRRRRKRRG
ncbi:receptor-like protein 9DC3 [Nicotiana tomentosiformis]|uniref:receptor-like protein 9DC3 n=1 Tax=Nicotiana tomentosiformis TaxID=4098 RepID=UPI00051BEC39|nr:receptor-like protein 6 isoform X1 [Nicotiana tomentosiformis]XP_033517143.1 receptor-like protein 6 isoform X2 [Nicotiana tomentosiformis]